MTKFKIAKLKTTAVILARTNENKELAGKTIEAKDCENVLGESYESIKARMCPAVFRDDKQKG